MSRKQDGSMLRYDRMPNRNPSPFGNFELKARIYSSFDCNTGHTSYYLQPILSDPIGTEAEVIILKDIEERLTGERLKVSGSSTIIPDRTIVTFSGADIVAIGKALDVDFAPDTRKGFVRSKSPDKYSTRDSARGGIDSPSVTPREVPSSSSVMADWRRLLGQLEPWPGQREFRDFGKRRRPPGGWEWGC
uniref:Uncharacterized protein n=1 Tax=Podospora anserina (strain S / ATCC MYA-4624 / DSM 980 / FGSC 10383) TaxID=515849 RepID=A0A090D6W1_PODAN|nr:Putative protein of unknown function [Podospora anserina S mat+]